MPKVIYTKRAMKNIKALDSRVKDRVREGIVIDAVLPRGEAYKGL